MAQQILVSEFLELFDEFATVPPTKVQMYFQLAKQRVAEGVWGANYKFGVYYLAAHMLVRGGGKAGTQTGAGGAAGGALTDITVGDLSRSFTPLADNDSGDSTLKTTAYGTMFLELRRETVIGATVTGAPVPLPGTIVGC